MVDGEFDGVTFQVEPFREFYRDAEPLFREHLTQVGESPDDHARKNLSLLQMLDDTGGLQCLTARVNGRMFGYLMTVIGPSLESPDDLRGEHTTFFASPAIRGLGMRLQRAALEKLRERGVGEVIMWAGQRGSGPRLGTFYRRLGAEDFERRLYKLNLELELMPWLGAAAAGVSAAAAVGGSLIQADAAKSAASKANAAQQQALEQARADFAPWRTTGGQANTATSDLLGLNGPDAATTAFGNYTTSPGYQFQLDQGLRAVDAGAAAKGILRSGATLKAEQAFGAGLADTDFTNYYNRLFDLSKLGESAASGSATASQTTGHDIAQTDLSLGSALASAYGNAAKGVGNAATGYLNNVGYQNALSNFGNPRIGTTSGFV